MQPRILSSLAILMIVCSCQHTVPNLELCVKLQNGAQCAYTIEGPERRLTEEEYQDVQLGKISMTAEAWGAVRQFIESACQTEQQCKDSKERIDYLERALGIERLSTNY